MVTTASKLVGLVIFAIMVAIVAFIFLTVPDSSTPTGSGDRDIPGRSAQP